MAASCHLRIVYPVTSDPLNGYIIGSYDETKTPKELSLAIFRFNFGQQIQDYLDIKVNTPANVSPVQTITYTIELRNNGQLDAKNIDISVVLPAAIRFVAASGNYFYQNAAEGEWVDYPDPNDAPETISWQLPTVPANSIQTFSIQAKVKFATSSGDLETMTGIYEYDPDYYKK